MAAASAVTRELLLFGVQITAIIQREGSVYIMQISTRKLVYLSILTALSIVLTRLGSIHIPLGGVEVIRIGFGGLPLIFAGVVFGPKAGGLVGAVADVIGYFINPMGPYMPHFTLSSFLSGFLPGLYIYYVFKGQKNYFSMLISIAIGQVVTSIIMVPYFLNTLFGVPYSVSLLPRIIGQAVHIPLYAYMLNIMFKYDVLRVDYNLG
ncbi:MAG: folate family ECF transporter S component [Halothermotrichaceae bacterium]